VPAWAADFWLYAAKDQKIVLALPAMTARESTDNPTLRQVLQNDLLMIDKVEPLPEKYQKENIDVVVRFKNHH
jgi:hypothetical protein